MNLRDQLLKSGLASKQQARKAEREVSKIQHKRVVEARSRKPDDLTDAEIAMAAQRESDRILNEKLNEERFQKVAEARTIDIIKRGDLLDRMAKDLYYFRFEGTQIRSIQVNEFQTMQLAAGNLGIVYLEVEDRFVLISKENTLKIAEFHPQLVVCLHKPGE